MEQKDLFGQFNLVERRDGSKCIIVGEKLIDVKDATCKCDVSDYDKKTLRKKFRLLSEGYDIMKITTTDGKLLYERIDWKTIKKDTKVLVSNDGVNWYRRYFFEYKPNLSLMENFVEKYFCTYPQGKTSWSVGDDVWSS